MPFPTVCVWVCWGFAAGSYVTSSYLEGEYKNCDIVDYGYNRDKKRGKKQIVVGLVCAENGCPVAVEVFKGNTSDSTTVNAKIAALKDKYKISNMIFVGDRGMLTQKNLDANEDTLTITALTHAAMKRLCDENNDVQVSLFDETTSVEVILPEEHGIRYALRKNPVRRKKEHEARTENRRA